MKSSETVKANFICSYVVIALSMVLTVGCDKTESSTSVDPGSDYNKYKSATCEFGSNDGYIAKSLPWEVARSTLETAAFEKRFNAAKLSGVLSTSANETIRYIDRDEVTVFKKDSDGIGCSLLAAAQPMDSRLADYWSSESSKTSADGNSRLMGLYLGKTTPIFRKVGRNDAVIIVRENAPRWTLVHEYMHHLFLVESEKQGYNDLEVTNRMESLSARLKIISAAPSRAELRESIKIMLEVVRLLDTKMVHYTLEEMAIEDRLRDLFARGSFSYVPTYSYDSAAWYISRSGEKAKEVYSSLRKALAEFESITERMGSIDYVQRGALENGMALCDSRIRQIADVMARNKGSYSSMGFGITGLVEQNEAYNTESCGHSEQMETTLNRVMEALNSVTARKK